MNIWRPIRLGSSIGAGFVGKVNVDVRVVISVVKKLLDSFLDDGDFLLVGFLEGTLGLFWPGCPGGTGSCFRGEVAGILAWRPPRIGNCFRSS